jgi:hypothetical protein
MAATILLNFKLTLAFAPNFKLTFAPTDACAEVDPDVVVAIEAEMFIGAEVEAGAEGGIEVDVEFRIEVELESVLEAEEVGAGAEEEGRAEFNMSSVRRDEVSGPVSFAASFRPLSRAFPPSPPSFFSCSSRSMSTFLSTSALVERGRFFIRSDPDADANVNVDANAAAEEGEGSRVAVTSTDSS